MLTSLFCTATFPSIPTSTPPSTNNPQNILLSSTLHLQPTPPPSSSKPTETFLDQILGLRASSVKDKPFTSYYFVLSKPLRSKPEFSKTSIATTMIERNNATLTYYKKGITDKTAPGCYVGVNEVGIIPFYLVLGIIEDVNSDVNSSAASKNKKHKKHKKPTKRDKLSFDLNVTNKTGSFYPGSSNKKKDGLSSMRYRFMCRSVQEKVEWVRCINEALVRDGTALPVKSTSGDGKVKKSKPNTKLAQAQAQATPLPPLPPPQQQQRQNSTTTSSRNAIAKLNNPNPSTQSLHFTTDDSPPLPPPSSTSNGHTGKHTKAYSTNLGRMLSGGDDFLDLTLMKEKDMIEIQSEKFRHMFDETRCDTVEDVRRFSSGRQHRQLNKH